MVLRFKYSIYHLKGINLTEEDFCMKINHLNYLNFWKKR